MVLTVKYSVEVLPIIHEWKINLNKLKVHNINRWTTTENLTIMTVNIKNNGSEQNNCIKISGILKTLKPRKIKRIKGKQQRIYKIWMFFLKNIASIIPLNINCLNHSTERQRCSKLIFLKIQLYAIYKRNINTHTIWK